MTNVDQLCELQAQTGGKIVDLLTNYRKAPKERKTAEYVQRRSSTLQALWKEFTERNNQLAEHAADHSEHPYFSNRYFEEVEKVRNQLAELLDQAGASTTKTTSSLPELKTAQSKRSSFTVDPDVSSPNTPDEVTRLLKRQRILMRTTASLINDIETKLQEVQPPAFFEYKRNMLIRYQMDLALNNDAIWEQVDSDEVEGYTLDVYQELDHWIQDTIITLQDQPSPSDTGLKPRLPKINIPSFDGTYSKWMQFHDLFLQLVHTQQISKAQKMFYLMGSVSGEARRLIQHLPANDQNYDAAWAILTKRYANKRLITTAFLNKLLAQPICQPDSAQSIRMLHDTTNECLKGLQSTGLNIDSWDPILIHIIVKRLDKATFTLYEQSLDDPRELSTIANLLQFLETRFHTLEVLGGKGTHHSTERQTTRKAFVATSGTSKCILCKLNHPLFRCQKFRSLATNERLQTLRKHGLCINCLSKGHFAAACSSRTCTKCSQKHHTMVHPEQTPPKEDERQPDTISPTILTTQAPVSTSKQVLLGTVVVLLQNRHGNYIECRAILDSGSQLNLITTRMVRKLSLPQTPKDLEIQGIGHSVQRSQQRVNLTLRSRITGFTSPLEAFVLQRISSQQPNERVDTSKWKIPRNIQLGDPHFDRPDSIDLLLGAEIYFELLSIGQIKLGTDLPRLQNTVLGWIVSGPVGNQAIPSATCGICTKEPTSLDEQVERFWALEEAASSTSKLTATELKCESHFNQTVRRDHNGRFIVSLPFSRSPNNLGESRGIALRRFQALQRKLSRDPELRILYNDFMAEYIRLGHMKEAEPIKSSAPHYFLPHHGILKPDSTTTKLRVVFDASAKTSSNLSLNDILLTGPTLQGELFSILLRFRIPRYVFSADIEKMYRQIRVNPNDQCYQRILWSNDPNAPPKEYQLETVTYGTTSAPYLAIKCLQHLAIDNASKLPSGSAAILRDFYVDDLMSGADSIQKARETQQQLNQILWSGGFKLRKWCANHPSLLQDIPPEDRALQLNFNDGEDSHIKTLGLMWLPKTDELAVTTQRKVEGQRVTKRQVLSDIHHPVATQRKVEGQRVTKRQVLSDIAHLFDPLGIMGPVIISAKIFLQRLWSLKLDWDAAVPAELHTQWVNFRNSLPELSAIRIPRHVFKGQVVTSAELHVFSDASERAYGAAVYVRSKLKNGQILVRLLCAKSKVAPLKATSLPKLELCGAKLAADLLHRVRTDLRFTWRSHLWTDSTIVLAWLRAEPANLQTFVRNRVSSILELTRIEEWRHVPSKQNPADIISRGISPDKLHRCHLWFQGPIFLHGAEYCWPTTPTDLHTDLETKQPKPVLAASPTDTPGDINDAIDLHPDLDIPQPVTTLTTSPTAAPDNIIDVIDHRNSFRHLQRVIAYILRFVKTCRNITNQRDNIHLNVDELHGALVVIIKQTQAHGFKEDLAHIARHGSVSASSSLNSLNPFLDEHGNIRVGGRLNEASIPYEAQHPLLLPYSHIVTRLIMEDIHRAHKHVGPQALLSITRQRFWPLKGKSLARSIVSHCVRCARFQPKLLSQQMGNLPSHRVTPARPFVNSGVDFWGPLRTHFRTRGKPPQKTYVAVFCCFATKAVHLELVTDLSTKGFIGALRRFIGRRGHCKTLYCDNATNFVGARNELEELQTTIYGNEAREAIISDCSTRGIDFHFIPPRSPHFGGLWEAAVKSSKQLLLRSVTPSSLTYEELETLIIEVEAILNSRPLTPMSADPNDLAAITPGHFLIGEPLTSSIPADTQQGKASLSRRWEEVQRIKAQFWQRWSQEYLHQLQQRYKWKQPMQNVEIGTMVIIKDDNLPPLKWPLGRIIRTFEGDDGLIRVAEVQTATTTLRRPIHRLAPLPIETEQEAETQGDNGSKAPKPKDDNNATTTKRNAEASTDTRTKRRRHLSPAAVLTSILLTLLVLPSSQSLPVEIRPFQTQPGLYFESVGTSNFIVKDWTLIIYIDLQPYWREYDVLRNGVQGLMHLCNTTKEDQACSGIVAQLQLLVRDIQEKNELLLHRPAATRTKRGLVNAVGNLSNKLFGILDSTYAEDMSKTITQIQQNEHEMASLLDNQTSIIDATLNIMRKSEEVIETHFQDLESFSKNLGNQIQSLEDRVQTDTVLSYFTTLAIRCLMIATSLQTTYASLLEVLLSSHQGHVNPQLISPTQLKDEVTKIKANLPSELRFPADKDDITSIYKLMTIQGTTNSKHVIFRLQLPLLEPESYSIFRTIPVPVTINDTFIAVKPSSTYIILNDHRDRYYPLNGQDLAQCISPSSDTYLCREKHPIYKVGARRGSCEIAMLHHSEPPTDCYMMTMDDSPYWYQLRATNQWLFSMPRKSTATLICNQITTQVSLEASGIVTLNGSCIIRQQYVTIHGYSEVTTLSRPSIVPVWNLTQLVVPTHLSPLLHPLQHYQTSANELEAMKTLVHSQLHRISLPKLSTHDVHQYTLGYVLVIAVVIMAAYYGWKKKSAFRRQAPPQPAPRQHTASTFTINLDPSTEV